MLHSNLYKSLEGAACYAGLLLAPAEGFGLRPRPLFALWAKQTLFNESALRPIQSISCDVRLCVSLSVGHTLETTLPEGLETSGRRAYR